ncbi:MULTISPECIES: amidohydrolase [unclassified Clostridium]|nr:MULTISPECIES: amidohydrolase [unclassified Clostridium]
MFFITNARVMTMAGKTYETGWVAIEDGKIAAVGEGNPKVSPKDEELDAGGAYLLPGFVDPHCHIGLFEDDLGREGEDGNEDIDPVTPHLRAIDGINPDDPSFCDALDAGITTVVTGPGSANVIGGQFAALKTYGRYVDEMVLKAPQSLKVAFGENPKRTYQDQEKSPVTRMATAALLRENLVAAQEYAQKLEEGEEDPDKRPERDLKLEIICQALRGELPVKAHAHRRDDIFTALRIAREFGLGMTVEHATEGHLAADVLKELGARVILGPYLCGKGKVELQNMSLEAPARLAKAGVPFALMSDHPETPVQFLPVQAALCVRAGLYEDQALRAITIDAARLCGIDDRVGSIEPGKDADLALFSAHPLSLQAKVLAVFVDGRKVR